MRIRVVQFIHFRQPLYAFNMEPAVRKQGPMHVLHLQCHTIEASIAIRRPVSEVFAFYRDFTNLPRFLGDVVSVEIVDEMTSRWIVHAPLKMTLRWTVTLTEQVENALIRYEMGSHPSRRISWTIHFVAGSSSPDTVVHEVLQAPLSALGLELMALFGKPAAKEVAANLQRLKELLETGQVTDQSYAVAGKFPSTLSTVT